MLMSTHEAAALLLPSQLKNQSLQQQTAAQQRVQQQMLLQA